MFVKKCVKIAKLLSFSLMRNTVALVGGWVRVARKHVKAAKNRNSPVTVPEGQFEIAKGKGMGGEGGECSAAATSVEG